jgi:hypothetical protein
VRKGVVMRGAPSPLVAAPRRFCVSRLRSKLASEFFSPGSTRAKGGEILPPYLSSATQHPQSTLLSEGNVPLQDPFPRSGNGRGVA